ncbi:MAG TPA: hypothetical protein VFS43_17735 [Polyangiaceae bacterium]|nr:hypothetical protein [Polyangiaceae bacterium]
MADRVDYYFRQKVTEAELDLGFELLERADRNLAADIGLFGIVSGAVPAPHSPLPGLSVDLTAPARAYDRAGQRVFFGTGQTVDCSVDHNGLPTEVTAAGNERWLSVFLRFSRSLSDPRTDGNSQQVLFRRDESFELVVRQGPEAPAGSAPRPLLEEAELLVCDVRRTAGQTQIVGTDLDLTRRQAFVFAPAGAVLVVAGLWKALATTASTVQQALDSADALLAQQGGRLGAHLEAAAGAHAASAVAVADAGGLLNAAHVEGALAEILGAFGAGHVRANEGANAGLHRAIRQPVLGAGRVLLFESGVTGANETRLRAYGDDGSVWVTFNAAWNGAAWARDTASFYAGGFRFARHEFAFLHDDLLAPAFADFAKQWTLRMNAEVNSGFETSGAVREVGRLGLHTRNPTLAVANATAGGAVTFRSRFPATPSSITLAPKASFKLPTPSVFEADRDGFGVFAHASLTADAVAYWHGTYTAVA